MLADWVTGDRPCVPSLTSWSRCASLPAPLYAAALIGEQLSTSDKRQAGKQGTQNPEAYALYLKGRTYWSKRTLSDLETAVSYFNQAIAKDPGYALAYAGLADTYSLMPDYGGSPSEDIPKSNAAARKALELDATLARPHAVLGSNKTGYEWDFAGGEAEFKKAIELDPTTLPRTSGTRRVWSCSAVGSRKALLKSIVRMNSIRTHL